MIIDDPGLNRNAMNLHNAVRMAAVLIVWLYAADATAQRWRFAVQAGGVGSKTYAVDGVSPPADDYNPSYRSPDRLGVFIGYHANFVFQYTVTPRFSVLFEPGYIAKGYSRGTFHGLFTTRRLHYAILPVLADVELSSRMAITFGPEFLYLLGPAGDLAAFNKWSLNGVVGFNYYVLPQVSAGLRYGQGVTPVNSVRGYEMPQSVMRGEETPPPTRAEYTQFVQAFLRYDF
jgi:hypothetical protein